MHCQTQGRSSTEQSAQAAQWRTAQHCSRLDKKGKWLAWTTSSVAWVAVFALDTSTHTVTEPHCDHGHKQSNRDWFEKGSLPSKRPSREIAAVSYVRGCRPAAALDHGRRDCGVCVADLAVGQAEAERVERRALEVTVGPTCITSFASQRFSIDRLRLSRRFSAGTKSGEPYRAAWRATYRARPGPARVPWAR